MALCFAFRVDAGLTIGTGHVMRCLTLADALAAKGHECHFLTREHDGHLNDLISARGHIGHVLPFGAPDYGDHPAPPPHADWLGGDWRGDARATAKVLGEIAADWLVLDHYALDRTWQEHALPAGVKLAVIDDLADRPHCADILIDQNLGRRAQAYLPLVPETCQLLIGPEFALLRPEFATLRPAALARRAKGQPLRHLLVSLGGVDKDNATGAVLDSLAEMTLPQDLTLTIVMGPHAPHLEAVQNQAAALSCESRVLTSVSNMAELMTQADLAIGAAGSTSWERACLGLPTVLLVLAENQKPGAKALQQSGLVGQIHDPKHPRWQAAFKTELQSYLADPQNAPKIDATHVDGSAVSRICACLLGAMISLRPATDADGQNIWTWRHAQDAWKFNKHPEPTPLETHLIWFEKALKNPQQALFIAQLQGNDIGYLRFDHIPDGGAEISICLGENARGYGLGQALIRRGCQVPLPWGGLYLSAWTHQDNHQSIRAFCAAGFKRHHQSDNFRQFIFTIPSTIGRPS